MKWNADRPREVTIDGNDPRPCPRLNRVAAKIGLLGLKLKPPLFGPPACLGQTDLRLIDCDNLVSEAGHKNRVSPLALPECQDRPRWNAVRDRPKEIVRLVAVREPRFGITLI